MSQPSPAETTVSRRALVEAIVASTIGTTIEWYDFFLTGIVTPIVFAPLFFPRSDPFTSQIAAFASLALGFVARPFGGVIFGYLGDRLGRKSTLVATLLLMGVSTVAIGCLPTYETAGIAAPILLTALRFVQGLGVGGEWGGSVLLALEYGHRGKRGFYAAWPQAGVPLGLLMAMIIVAGLQSSLGANEFLAWGWRIPFWLSAVLILVGLLIRMRLLETPLFAQLQERKELAEAPVRETIRRHWREILLAAGARIAENACFYLFTNYLIAYNETTLHVADSVIFNALILAAIAEFFLMPVYGLLSDGLSRRRIYMAGCFFLGAFAFPYFALLHTREPVWMTLGVVVVLLLGHAPLYSVQASLIPELFGTRLRYTGASIGYQLASPLAGGLAPIIATWLAGAFPGQFWPLAVYVMAIALLSLVCVQRLAETSGKDISAE